MLWEEDAITTMMMRMKKMMIIHKILMMLGEWINLKKVMIQIVILEIGVMIN